MSSSIFQQNTLPFNQVSTDPSLRDLLDQIKKDIFLSMSVHHIGTIQSFDETNQTATATINYQKTFYTLNDANGTYEATVVDYPLLVDCPVICLGGGTASLTFPISQGDECLILFNDRDIDNWFDGASTGPVATPRLHSFSDGIIIVGVRSLANSLTNYDTDAATLQNGDVNLKVYDDEILATNGASTITIDASDITLESTTIHLTAGNSKVVMTNTQTTVLVGTAGATLTSSSASLAAAGATLGLSGGKLSMTNATKSLSTILNSLITNIEALVTATAAITVTGVTVGGGVSGVPANAATITAINTALATNASDLGALLS